MIQYYYSRGTVCQILDDVLAIFSELPHSPIKLFGVNLEVHFKLQAPAQRLALGRTLAPVAPWGEFGKCLESKDLDRVEAWSVSPCRRIAQPTIRGIAKSKLSAPASFPEATPL